MFKASLRISGCYQQSCEQAPPSTALDNPWIMRVVGPQVKHRGGLRDRLLPGSHAPGCNTDTCPHTRRQDRLAPVCGGSMAELWRERLGTRLGPEPSQSSDRRSKVPVLRGGLRAPWRGCWSRAQMQETSVGGSVSCGCKGEAGWGRDRGPQRAREGQTWADDRRTTVMTVGMMTL